MGHIRENKDDPDTEIHSGDVGPETSEKSAAQASAVSCSPEGTDGQDIDDIDPKEERAFLWRLDLGFLTVGFLGYVFKNLDQSNISNAYVSGMQEDLKLYGNQLNYFTTYFK